MKFFSEAGYDAATEDVEEVGLDLIMITAVTRKDTVMYSLETEQLPDRDADTGLADIQPGGDVLKAHRSRREIKEGKNPPDDATETESMSGIPSRLDEAPCFSGPFRSYKK